MKLTQVVREELISDITTSLSPWIMKDELNHAKKGASYIPTVKLAQMSQFVQDQKTTGDQKALLAKTILATSHYNFLERKSTKAVTFLSLSLMATIGVLSLGLHGMVHKNNKEQAAACTAGVAAYVLAEHTKQKFLKETKDSRSFFRILGHDKEELDRVHSEFKKWCKPSR